MNTPRSNTRPSSPSWVKRHWLALIGLIVTMAVVSVVAYAKWYRRLDSGEDVPVFAAKRGRLTISITQEGGIRNRDLVILRSEVEGRTTILELIDEGTHVEAGQELVKLDASGLEDARTQQQITVLNAEAAFIRVREDREVTRSQGESDVAKGELTYRFAKLDLEKYIEGEYPKQLQQAESDITIATEELQRASDELAWSGQLAAEGYITQTELLADELAMKRSMIKLELAETDLRLLEQFTHQRDLDRLESDVEQGRMALDRAVRKAAANDVQAEAELTAKESQLERQQDMLTKIDEQIVKCTITSPIDGMVVYATTGAGRGRHRYVEPLAVQQEVQKMQDLIYLPTSSSMMIEVSVPEASIPKISVDMPVRIRVDAVPNASFSGRVGKIGLIPASEWWRPGVIAFTVEIYLEGDAGQLRSGMSCEAEIIVDEYGDVVYVPVQAVVRVGRVHAVYVRRDGESELRPVTIGLDNNRMIAVLDGLAEGEQVLLAPPLQPSTAPEELAEQSPVAQTDEADSQDGDDQAPQIDFSKLKDMTPEQRREFIEKLTPEHREQLKKVMQEMGIVPGGGHGGGQGGRPGGGGRGSQ